VDATKLRPWGRWHITTLDMAAALWSHPHAYFGCCIHA
jgi:hypothetical protein